MKLFSTFLLSVVVFLAKVGSVPFFVFSGVFFFISKTLHSINKRLAGMEKVVVRNIIILEKKIAATAQKLKRLIFRKSVLYGFLSALFVVLSFHLGLYAGHVVHEKKLVELQQKATIKIVDRNNVLLYTFKKNAAGDEYMRAPAFVKLTLKQIKEKYKDSIYLYGGTVKTTLDLSLQNQAQAAVLEAVMQNQPVQDGYLVLTDTKTGEVLAYVNSVHNFDGPSKIRNRTIDLPAAPFLNIIDAEGKMLYSKSSKNVSIDDVQMNNLSWSAGETITSAMGDLTAETFLDNYPSTELISQNINSIHSTKKEVSL